MKSFIYTTATDKGKRRNSAPLITVNVYRIVRNRLVYIGRLTDDYVQPFQLVMSLLCLHKQLPLRAFQRYPNGCVMYTNASQLEADGIAYIRGV